MQTTTSSSLQTLPILKIVTYSLLLGLYIPTFYKLFSYGWRLADYTHGPLILLAFLWLLWKKRDFFSSPPANSVSALPLILLIVGLALYAFGSVQRLLSVEIFSLIPVSLGTAAYLHGKEADRGILFPVFFLIFLVPLPLFVIDILTSSLKMIVAQASEFLLNGAGYLVGRNGVLLFIGDYHIVVGDACSGIRSLVSLLSVGALYVYLIQASIQKKVFLFLSVIPIAIVANILRLTLLALITYHFGEAAGQGFFHNVSGILVFVMALSGLILLDFLINWRGLFSKLRPSPAGGKG